jgi:general secretion pathway protein G
MTHHLISRGRRRTRGAFTLIEMLIVLSIIALLVGMAIYNLTGVNEGAKEQKVQADLLAFKELLAAYELQNGNLPTTEQGIKALWTRPTDEPVPPHWRALLEKETLDPWGHPYQYLYPGKHNPERYDVWSMGPDGQTDTADDIGNWTSPATGNP